MTAERRGPFFLDITRLVTRTGDAPLTGIDRVERAYLKALIDRDLPHFLCSRTALGWLVVGGQWSQRVLAWIDQPQSLAPPGLFARLIARPRRTPALEAAVRGIAMARLTAAGLKGWIEAAAPGGGWWLSVGHMNLNDPTLGAARQAGLHVAAMIHDTIPVDHPDWAGKGAPARLAAAIDAAGRHADRLLTPSHSAARDLARHVAPGSAGRILVAPLGVEGQAGDPAALPPAFDASRPNFLALGTIEPRRNLPLLLDVWDGFLAGGEATPCLHVIGRLGWGCEDLLTRLRAHGAAATPVHYHPALPDAGVAAMMDRAVALLAPSRAEGFGLPPAEAALRGVPVLATDLAVTRETLGDYALYLDPDDRAAWANAIRNLATAPGKRPPLRLADWTAHFNLVFNHL